MRRRVALMAFFLLQRVDTPMRVVLTLSGLMLLASVVTGAVTLISPAQRHVDLSALSEPAGLVVLGAGFILVAAQVRRKKI
jgi:uncharacterized membrane protein YfcA